MNPTIDQSLLENIQILRHTDYTCRYGSIKQRSIWYRWYFGMRQEKMEIAAIVKYSIALNRYILN